MSPSSNLKHLLVATSWLCGWLYFLAWSISFWPQPLLNLRRKSTRGLTPDFPLLNVFGFIGYTVTTSAFLYSPEVRSQYAARHPQSPEPTVRFNDFVFALHASVFCVITYTQFWPRLWGWPKDAELQAPSSPLAEDGDETDVAKGRRLRATTHQQRPQSNSVTLGVLWGCIVAIVVVVFVVLSRPSHGSDPLDWAWIDVMYAFTYAKLLMTIFKYTPQAISNVRRKSTFGFSIVQVSLDFGGGILSMLQLVIDSSLQADWSGLTGNPLKFGLANISLIFDLIFLIQHFVLYGPVEEVHGVPSISGEEEPLLGTRE